MDCTAGTDPATELQAIPGSPVSLGAPGTFGLRGQTCDFLVDGSHAIFANIGKLAMANFVVGIDFVATSTVATYIGVNSRCASGCVAIDASTGIGVGFAHVGEHTGGAFKPLDSGVMTVKSNTLNRVVFSLSGRRAAAYFNGALIATSAVSVTQVAAPVQLYVDAFGSGLAGTISVRDLAVYEAAS